MSGAYHLGLRIGQTARWTAERVEHLRQLAKAGLTVGQIVAELGGGVTRNGVLSKIHRANIEWPNRIPAGLKGSAQRALSKVPQAINVAKSQKAERAESIFGGPRAAMSGAQLSISSPKPLPIAIHPDILQPPMRDVSLFDLRHDECRWPTRRDAENDQWLFCGTKRGDDRRYCPYHCRIANPLMPKPVKRGGDREKSKQERELTAEFGPGPNIFRCVGDAA